MRIFENIIEKNIIKKPLYLSENFKNVLLKIVEKGDSKICEKFLEFNNNENYLFDISFIDRTDNDDSITFVQTNRIKNYDLIDINDYKTWKTIKGKTEIKIGRFIRKVFGTKFDQQSIENFVNKYKSIIRNETYFDKFELVKGNDILHWYLGDNYNESRGTLGGSCMQSEYCQTYFGIYKNNPNQVSLCILKNENGTKIKGRAIIWNVTKPDIIFMDRIYTNDDADVNIFLQYAKNNGWYCKKRQSYNEGDDLIAPDGSVLSDTKMKVVLENDNFNRYPYMDTMRYYHYDINTIANHYISSKDYYILNDTGGYYEDYDGDYEPNYVTDWRGDEINEENAVWCEFDDVYCLSTEAIYVRKGEVGRSKYFIPNSPFIKYSFYSDSYYHTNDVIYSEFLKDWIYKKYAVKMYFDKEKNKWSWMHKLCLHDDMGKINSDYYVNDILYREQIYKDGKVIDGEYHFIDDKFLSLPLGDDPEDNYSHVPKNTKIYD